ncbi:unnamed protein product [Linum trigynum]|uniref:Uncharacterized protein n=1 Tax=Linum trigynum TaxID=586398 RepID=A0AAV2D3T9_9ROSI
MAANQATISGTAKGKKQESLRDGGITKGKQSLEQLNGNGGTKGKSDQQGNQGSHLGKTVDGKKAIGEGKTTAITKEWRPIGPHTKEASTSKEPKKVEIDTTLTSSHQPTLQLRQVLNGPNNTKIQIVEVPDLNLEQKENVNPNKQGDSTIRNHYHRKKPEHAPQSKGVNLKATKKPLQILSPKMKESLAKQIPSSLPISLKSIEDFCVPVQRRKKGTNAQNEGKADDIPMQECLLSRANEIQTREEEGEPPGNASIETPCSN